MGRLVEIKKANRDQNSSPGASITLRHPDGKFKVKVTHAGTRTGAFAGQTRGVGRHLGRDQNSSPGATKIRTPTLREINGKFAGDGPGVKVFHPARYGSTHRAPRDNRLQHWTKEGDDVARTFKGKQREKVTKADEPRKGVLAPVELINMQAHTGARVGRRIPS